jgi:hypothetical protein
VKPALVLLLTLFSAAGQSQTAQPKETLLQKLLRIAGLTAAPSQMRAPGDPQPGDIWVVALQDRMARPLTQDGGYRSPVFGQDDAFIYALRDDVVVRIPVGGGTVVQQGRTAEAVKLVGFDGPDDLTILTNAQPPASPLASLSLKTGRLAPLPHDPKSPEELRLIAFVRGDERVYGTTRVYTRTESRRSALRTTEWTDVIVARGTAAPVNVSACDGINCGAPALSHDGRFLAYVKAP